MAHLSDGTLRRMYDDPDSVSGVDTRHYSGCAACQSRFAAAAGDARAIGDLLAVPAMRVDVGSAFKQVITPAAQPRFGIRLPIIRPARPTLIAGLAAAVALIAIVAAQTLNIFQPAQLTPVPITVGDLQALSGLSDYGTVTWTTQPQPQLVTSAADAAQVSGLPVPVVGPLPAGVSNTVTYAAMPKAVALFTFSAEKAAAAVAKNGKSLPPLPKNMDGATMTLTVGPAVVEIFGDLNNSSTSNTSQIKLPDLIVVESTAPVITSTQVSVQQIEDYVASVPGVSPELAKALKSIKDPSTTLPIPIPIQYATSQSVKVQGFIGLGLGDNTGLGSAVIWVNQHTSTVYAIAGGLKLDEVVTIANQLR